MSAHRAPRPNRIHRLRAALGVSAVGAALAVAGTMTAQAAQDGGHSAAPARTATPSPVPSTPSSATPSPVPSTPRTATPSPVPSTPRTATPSPVPATPGQAIPSPVPSTAAPEPARPAPVPHHRHATPAPVPQQH
ncbi:hypothetical protein ACFFVH_03550 [Streptomyces echinatus]|uniref:hypothetical protein n=1 Tax=Streptomyces echinatus TaxID=67293 RepID=UPI0035E67FD7